MSRSISAKSSKMLTNDADAVADLLVAAPPDDEAAFVTDACLSRAVEFKSDTMRSIRELRSAAGEGGGEAGATDASLPSPPAPIESDGRPSVASSVARRSSILDGAVLALVALILLAWDRVLDTTTY